MRELIITSDGSHTVYVPELKEHYHSVHGAIQESTHIFIESGLKFSKAEPVNILEVGFGTGLNALLTAIESARTHRTINYTALEKYPLEEDIIGQLNYGYLAGNNELFGVIHSSLWNRMIEISNSFRLQKQKLDIISDELTGSYDLIYYDAFGPDKQPGMWTVRVFSKISAATKKDAILVTYSAKGEVKRNLRSCGFEVELLPGPPGKRQIIRAIKI